MAPSKLAPSGPVMTTQVCQMHYSPGHYWILRTHAYGPTVIVGGPTATYPTRQAAEEALVELLATEAVL